MEITRRRGRANHPEILKLLMETKLFKLSTSEISNYVLKLVGTRYIILVPCNKEAESGQCKWEFAPPGSLSANEFKFYRGRPSHNLRADPRRESSLEEIFEEVPADIIEKLIYHLDILPR